MSNNLWTSDFTIEQVMDFIVSYWETDEGKKYTAQLTEESFNAIQNGIYKMTGNQIDNYTIGGLVNGYCHTPEGAIYNYIYSKPVPRVPCPSEKYMIYAYNRFGLKISLEETEKILDNMGAKRVGQTFVNSDTIIRNGEHYIN